MINRFLERFGYYILAVLMADGYTVLRFTLNTQFTGATWQSLYDLTAAIPGAYRVLVPLLSRPLVGLGFSVKQAYFTWEFVASFLLIVSLYATFKLHVTERWAKAFSLLFVFVLPLAFLLGFQWPIFYPWDTPAMCLIVFCLWLMFKEKWWWLLGFMFIATLNRESSILVPLLFGVMYFDRLPVKVWAGLLAALFLIFLVVRWEVAYVMRNNPVLDHGRVSFLFNAHWRVNHNVLWLLRVDHLFLLLSTLAFFPVLYFSLIKFVPSHLRMFPLVAFFCFMVVPFVGNFYEPRQFGEILVILYIPLSLALYTYLTGLVVCPPTRTLQGRDNTVLLPAAIFLEKYGYFLVFAFAALATVMMNLLGVHYFYPSLEN